ncbi:MAG: calcium-translocating P-type ATPase, SERCA-type [Firmicutes bacterium]|nr:calcium-translocating P-type ATPase, SERCA-type [Bacillota bacterium]
MSGQWHQLTKEEVLKRLQSDPLRGLDDKEAGERAKRFGLNELARTPGIPAWQMFLNQFKDFMVIVLLAATAISGVLGEWADAITIMVIVVVNAILGLVQEYRAERSMEALRQLTAPEANVIRDGGERKIPSAELVPGDIVLVEAGDRVPADLRIIEEFNLEVEESALTGESFPVKKETGVISGETSLGDTFNMAFFGTVVTRGRAKGMVVLTGMATEMGQIAGLIQTAAPEQTPLQRRLAQVGTWLVSFCLLICFLVVVVGIYRGLPAYQMFLAGVSLAVAAIPEGLPAIVTVALALGVQRMIKRNAIIRKLPAVETLGCATVICSDKTGTLTQNEMTVRKAFIGGVSVDISGEGYEPHGNFKMDHVNEEDFKIFMEIASLCNNSSLQRGSIDVGGLFRKIKQGVRKTWSISGDPTEGALLVMAAKAGVWKERLLKKQTLVHEIPFDSERKRMSVVYNKQGKSVLYTKGAPDVVLDLCSHYVQNGKKHVLTPQVKRKIMDGNASLAENALRVLALAYKELPGKEVYTEEEAFESSLVFVGLAGMIDPPRAEAIKAVYTCKRAGIKTVMITGDHQVTARAVAAEMGILDRKNELVLTGVDLDGMSDERLEKVINKVAVCARVSPKHKLRIVRALKNKGHVVAMTGDGVNDAPAVKEADIGISMGVTGTDVTKEASAMVLADDNFSSIVAAVEEGRGIYDNIRKFIRYLLSCNVGEVLVMFLAVLGGLPLPLLPIQLLWMNLVTDGLPAMALGIDPIEKGIMSRKPRDPGEGVFSEGLSWRILGTGIIFAAGTLGVFIMSYIDSGLDLGIARTMAFNTLVFFQLLFVFACRSEHQSLLQVGIFTNKYLIIAVLISTALQLSVTYVPVLQPIFKTVPLQLQHWMVIGTVTLTPMFLGILVRHVRLRAKERVMYVKV